MHENLRTCFTTSENIAQRNFKSEADEMKHTIVGVRNGGKITFSKSSVF